MELEHEPQQEETHREEPAQSTFVVPPRIPNRPPPLGKFMTPQAPRHRDFNAGISGAASVRRSGRHAHVRYSVGGFTPGGIQGMHAGIQPQPMLIASKAEGAPSGPRRVRLMEPWKVEDIVVPVVGEEDEEGEGMEEEDDVKEEEVKDEKTEYVEDMQPPMTPSRGRRDRLTDEERQVSVIVSRSPDTSRYSNCMLLLHRRSLNADDLLCVHLTHSSVDRPQDRDDYRCSRSPLLSPLPMQPLFLLLRFHPSRQSPLLHRPHLPLLLDRHRRRTSSPRSRTIRWTNRKIRRSCLRE